MSEIQSWYSFDGLDVSEDVLGSGLRIYVRDASPLPQELESSVEQEWRDELTKQHKIALFDSDIIYLDGRCGVGENCKFIPVVARSFRFMQVLNRRRKDAVLPEEVKKHKLLHLNTHFQLVTKDGMRLWGAKSNLGDKLSNYGGVGHIRQEGVIINGLRYLNMNATIRRHLRDDISHDASESVCSIHAVGVTYCDRPGFRGTDHNYVVTLDIAAEKLLKQFKPSPQLGGLVAVEHSPVATREFLIQGKQKGVVFSPYALGCEYNAARALFGEVEATKLLEVLRGELGASIATENQTNYFS